MSGSGRKSQYRKSVTSNFLNENNIPSENEEIVLVLGNRGSNLFEIQLSSGGLELARLPNKFNKLIWVKKNDFLIVERNDDSANVDSTSTSKVKFVINNIINKDNIRALKSQNLWPIEFETEKIKVLSYDKNDLMPGYEEDIENDDESEI
jgi:probable RNA-binding protein EIF1AD